jgi:hypothetical protein
LAFSLLLTSPVQDSWPRHNTQTSDRTKQTAGNIMAPVRAANVVFKVLGPTAFTLAARTWVVWTPPGGVNLWAMHRPLGASAAGRCRRHLAAATATCVPATAASDSYSCCVFPPAHTAVSISVLRVILVSRGGTHKHDDIHSLCTTRTSTHAHAHPTHKVAMVQLGCHTYGQRGGEELRPASSFFQTACRSDRETDFQHGCSHSRPGGAISS